MSFDKLSYHKGDTLSLPKGWEIKKLGEIASFSQGIQVGLEHHLTEPKEGYVRFIRIVDYTQNTDDIRYIPNPGEKYFVNEEDIVMVRYGTPGLIGRGKAGVIANNLFKIKIERKDLTNDYLTLFLSQEHIQNYLGTQGSATMPALNFGQLKTVEVKFPPLPEQQRIVSILDEAFAAIAKAKTNAEQNLKNVKELFESYLQGVFGGSTGSPTKRDGWEEKSFEELIQENQIGLIKSTKEQGNDKPYRYLKMDSITSDNNLIHDKYVYVDAEKSELEKYTLNEGDFLFNTRNSYELVGKTCVFAPLDDEPTLFNNNIMRVVFKNGISSRFINYAFSSELVKERLQKLKSGTTSVVGIYYKGLRNLKIPVTQYEQQQTIVRQLDALRAETQKLEAVYQKKIDDLEELKKSILQKAFSGGLNLDFKDSQITKIKEKSSNQVNQV